MGRLRWLALELGPVRLWPLRPREGPWRVDGRDTGDRGLLLDDVPGRDPDPSRLRRLDLDDGRESGSFRCEEDGRMK